MKKKKNFSLVLEFVENYWGHKENKKKNEILLQSTQETAVLQKAPHLKLTKRKIWL